MGKVQRDILGVSYGRLAGMLFRWGTVPSVPKHRRMLGEQIRAYRKQAGLSQEKLAEKADLNPTYVSDVERGEENISVDALVRIASALGVHLRDLVAEI